MSIVKVKASEQTSQTDSVNREGDYPNPQKAPNGCSSASPLGVWDKESTRLALVKTSSLSFFICYFLFGSIIFGLAFMGLLKDPSTLVLMACLMVVLAVYIILFFVFSLRGRLSMRNACSFLKR